MTSDQLARLCAGIPVQVINGFSGPKPLPPRKTAIDPETRLKRKDKYIRPLHEGQWVDREAANELRRKEERLRLRAMADTL